MEKSNFERIIEREETPYLYFYIEDNEANRHVGREAGNLKVDMDVDEMESIANNYYGSTKDDMFKKYLLTS